jgi:hypothetical protein
MTSGGLSQRLPVKKRRRFAVLPHTRPGKWAVGLTVAAVVLMAGWRLMGPVGALPALACGLAGGVVALIAIFRNGERAATVFAALVPFLNTIVFVLAEFLIGHD